MRLIRVAALAAAAVAVAGAITAALAHKPARVRKGTIMRLPSPEPAEPKEAVEAAQAKPKPKLMTKRKPAAKRPAARKPRRKRDAET